MLAQGLLTLDSEPGILLAAFYRSIIQTLHQAVHGLAQAFLDLAQAYLSFSRLRRLRKEQMDADAAKDAAWRQLKA